ncbi:hypothetical protein ACM66B_002589 [Microbotryomycetes sp. NB124-2]
MRPACRRRLCGQGHLALAVLYQPAVAIVLLYFFLNLNPHHILSFEEFRTTFDFLGLALIVGGVIALLVGFSLAEQDWSSPQTWAAAQSVERNDETLHSSSLRLF